MKEKRILKMPKIKTAPSEIKRRKDTEKLKNFLKEMQKGNKRIF